MSWGWDSGRGGSVYPHSHRGSSRLGVTKQRGEEAVFFLEQTMSAAAPPPPPELRTGALGYKTVNDIRSGWATVIRGQHGRDSYGPKNGCTAYVVDMLYMHALLYCTLLEVLLNYLFIIWINYYLYLFIFIPLVFFLSLFCFCFVVVFSFGFFASTHARCFPASRWIQSTIGTTRHSAERRLKRPNQ